MVIADDQVAVLHPPPDGYPVLTFPAGEASKTRASWEHLTDALIAGGFGRDTVIVALGGGVTGDLAGFVAATCFRGLSLIQVPTTLLAMLDASVGGKTAVDTPAGKNLVGAFHQPAAVLMDPLVLRTLPDREFRTGLAEAVKHAIIDSEEHARWLGSHADSILARDPAVLDLLLRRSLAVKVSVVEADETEQGRRAVLNAGHTVGHAMEAATTYALSHGEAVALGLVLEAVIGEQLGVTAPGTARQVRSLLSRFGLWPDAPPRVPADAVLAAMRADKKNRTGAIHMALPARIGLMTGDDRGGWTRAVTEPLVIEALATLDPGRWNQR